MEKSINQIDDIALNGLCFIFRWPTVSHKFNMDIKSNSYRT